MKRSLPSRYSDLLKSGDVLFLLAIVVGFLFFLKESFNYPSESSGFPRLIILGTLILSGSLLLVYFLFPSLKKTIVFLEPEDEEASKTWKTRGRFYRGWLSIVVSILTAFLFGFLFLIPVSFVSYTLLLGRRGMLWKILLLALTTTLLVYIVFDWFLGIPTIRGYLWSQ
ncbi:MAG: tripartite tricarboxylate transporter TctB family protein [Thermodesulfobacteriota bacterium]